MQLKVPELYRTVVNGLNGELEVFDMEFLLNQVCLPLVFVILSLVVGRFLWRVCFFGTAIKVERDLRSVMFDKCRTLSQNFYSENKVGDLMSLFTNDLDTIHECFGGGILQFCDALTLGVMTMIKMGRMNIVLTLFSLIPMVFLLIISLIVGKEMTKRWDKRQAAFSKLSDFSQESFSGFAVIKAFVIEVKELKAFRKLNNENEETNVSYVKISTLFDIFITLFVESVFCVIFGYGGYLVKIGTFNAGQLIEFIGYFTSIVWPIMAISMLIDQRSRGKASLQRVTKLLDEKVDVTDGENVVLPSEPIKGKIEFKNLTFRYPGSNHDNVKDVSFTIEAGDNVGIIGKTGSGKTTICDLILRTYNVPDGTLFVDDKDVNTIPIEFLRKYTSYVPQDNFLFSDTILNNIAFASDGKELETVRENAEMSCVDGDIQEFPNQYETVLGERGVTVSGGQKQRISIARALMKNAPILILDDSVSAVDTDTEAKILKALKTSRKGKTTILVAHRVSTIKYMKKIIYVEDGKIVAVGSHMDLYMNCPAYRKTVDLQEFEDERGGDMNA